MKLVLIALRGGASFHIADVSAFVRHDEGALELASSFCVDAEIGGQFYGASHAFGDVAEAAIGEDCAIEGGEKVVAGGHDAAQILANQVGIAADGFADGAEKDALFLQHLLRGGLDRDGVHDGIVCHASQLFLLIERDAQLVEGVEELGVDLIEALFLGLLLWGGNKESKLAVEVLLRYKEVLEKGQNARIVEFDNKDQMRVAHDLFLLTAKPVLYVCNVDETAAKTGNDYSARVEQIAKEEGAEVLVIAAKTEEDIAELETYEDKQMFLEELGLEESGVNRLIKKAYSLLNLETFITAGEMEVKAWTYHKGWKAPQCAGVIHTDFEKGFIRAEVIKYDDYIEYGSEAAVRDAGKMGIEGKEYVVQDGDIMHFRFNV